ncbi:MAG: hypothetical protein MUF25_20405 [Pirellulaceae bacterium]|nr:hypothetical protein [Pirellulaceae bacterium]
MNNQDSAKPRLIWYAVSSLVISLPFTAIHLLAKPDDAPITPLQHVAAAIANFFGPWGVALVRLVDFPNAGMRSFSWAWAIGLTMIGGLFLVLATLIAGRLKQLLLTALWAVFVVVWFGVGLMQIADGLF